MTPAGTAPLPPRTSRGPDGSGPVRADHDRPEPDERAEVLATMPSRLSVAAGAWLLVAPFALDYSTTAAGFHAYWNDVAAGMALIALGLLRTALPIRTGRLLPLSAALGCWLVAAPFVLGFAATGDAPRATANDVLAGVLVGVLALLSTLTEKRLRD